MAGNRGHHDPTVVPLIAPNDLAASPVTAFRADRPPILLRANTLQTRRFSKPQLAKSRDACRNLAHRRTIPERYPIGNASCAKPLTAQITERIRRFRRNHILIFDRTEGEWQRGPAKNAASTPAARQFGSGGTASARSSSPRFARYGLIERAPGRVGEVHEAVATKKQDRGVVLKFLRRSMKRYSRPEAVVTDQSRSYGTALRVPSGSDLQVTGRWLSNRAESHTSHLTTRTVDAPFQADAEFAEFTSDHGHSNQKRHI